MNSLLQSSIHHYRQMLSLLESFRDLGLDNPDTVLSVHEEFASLQSEVEEIDGRINDLLLADGIPGEALALLQERLEIMTDVAEANRLAAPRLTAMMAVLQSELSELRAGMTAVAGYAGAGGIQGARFKAEG